MVYRGHVKNGVVVLDDPASLADGVEVTIHPARPTSKRRKPKAKRKTTTLGQRLMKYAGKAKGLPADFARNHDHYLHGVPKK